MCRSGLDLTPIKISAPPRMEIINLRHLEWFQLASDVSNQRAQYYANIQKFSRNYVERCLRKCIFCPNGQIVEVCNVLTFVKEKKTKRLVLLCIMSKLLLQLILKDPVYYIAPGTSGTVY